MSTQDDNDDEYYKQLWAKNRERRLEYLKTLNLPPRDAKGHKLLARHRGRRAFRVYEIYFKIIRRGKPQSQSQIIEDANGNPIIIPRMQVRWDSRSGAKEEALRICNATYPFHSMYEIVAYKTKIIKKYSLG